MTLIRMNFTLIYLQYAKEFVFSVFKFSLIKTCKMNKNCGKIKIWANIFPQICFNISVISLPPFTLERNEDGIWIANLTFTTTLLTH